MAQTLTSMAWHSFPLEPILSPALGAISWREGFLVRSVAWREGFPVGRVAWREGFGGRGGRRACPVGWIGGQGFGSKGCPVGWLRVCPLSSEFDTHHTAKARFWPWLEPFPEPTSSK